MFSCLSRSLEQWTHIHVETAVSVASSYHLCTRSEEHTSELQSHHCISYANIGYDVRLVDAKEYAVKDATTLYGFVCGLLASNHDVTDLFIDSALKICGEDIPAFAEFLDKFNAILGDNIHCMITASVEEDALPESAKKYIG